MSASSRPRLEWISIDKILPSHLNPRRELAAEIEDIKQVLTTKGWQEPITVWQRGNCYIIKSGHRRWHAARELGMKEVPCFITEPPENQQKEAEQMASHQGAHLEWSVYEWAKFTYDMWISWNKPAFAVLGKSINKSGELVKQYITVFEVYEKDEVEEKLEKQTYAMATLYKMSLWLAKLKKRLPALVESMSEGIIRKMLLRKLENKRITNQMLNGDRFIDLATEDQMKKFLTSPDMTLIQARFSMTGTEKNNRVGTWPGQMQRLVNMTRDLPTLVPQNKEQVEALVGHLDTLILEANRKRRELRQLAHKK